jgi:hypothetical protein
MRRHSIVLLSAAASMACALLPNEAISQQKSLKEQLVGTWTYVSSTATLPDGRSLWGTDPKGLMILTPNGRFSWQLFRSDRPKFASKNRMQGTPEENAADLRGSLAYFGTYSVDEAEKTITTVVEGSTFPNSEGETLKRTVTRITTDTLIYENPSTTQGERVESVWRRLN